MGCNSSTSTASEQKQFHQIYKLGKKLGEGAFGQVRVAKQRADDKELAVKIIDARCRGFDGEPSKEADRERVLASRTEIKVWEAIGENEHCVTLVASFFEKNLFYMVMEKCNCSLMDKLSKMSSNMENDLTRIFAEMLMGIRHVHQVMIAHRDIKPDNFLFGGTKDGETVKLCDFGLATKMPKSGLLKGVYGTAPYMSPEMLSGGGYDLATDVWSFGATCYLMVHGDFPYSPREGTAVAMKKAILTGKPEMKFVRPSDEEQFFSRAFVDKATPFLQALLQRSPATRRTAGDALKLPFLAQEKSTVKKPTFELQETIPEDGNLEDKDGKQAPLAPAIRKARKATKELKQPIAGIKQRNLDELLEKLQDRLGRSGDTQGSFYFSEEDEVNPIKSKSEPSDDRIRRRSESRHSTHSGVLKSVDAKAAIKESPV